MATQSCIGCFANKVMKLCKSARSRFYYDRISHLHHTNPKKWWDNKLSCLSKPPAQTSITVDESILRQWPQFMRQSTCPSAESLTTFHDWSLLPSRYRMSRMNTSLALKLFSLTYLRFKCVSQLALNEIPNCWLKNFVPVISRPICSIFNSSFRPGASPRFGNVLMSHHWEKYPPRYIDSDLGPISLTAVFSKFLERFIFSWLAPIVMPHIITLSSLVR